MEFSVSTTRGQHLLGGVVVDCLLEQLIGYGGSSAVFLAQPRDSEQKVAVKVFLPRSTMDSQAQKSFYRRFLREAQAASELDHPHILSIYAYGEHQGLPYIVMPYMPGGTLAEYVKLNGPLSLRVAQSYLQQIADALDYAHKCGCVHCDVKPANILLGQGGQVVLSDFGIVRLLQGTSLTAKQSTQTPEMLMGTPDYISPEQALGEPLDGRSDIYSLAITLYYLLAGNPPFNADSSIAMALMHVHEKPPLLGLQRADVTPQIDEVIDKALAKWPEERYQSAGAFSAAFSEAVSHVDNIDQVALINRAPNRRLMGKAHRNGASFEPEVRVKPMSRRPTLLRNILLILTLCVLLMASIATFFVLHSVNNAHPPITPGASNGALAGDILAGDESDWPSSPISRTFFFSSDGRYHIVNKSANAVALALYGTNQFANYLLSVTTSEIAGNKDNGDYYGVVLRSDQEESHYYLFEISAYDGGQYGFWLIDASLSLPVLLAYGPIPSFKAAAGQNNVITVQANGNTFTFFVNGTQIGKSIPDKKTPAFTSGEVGLSVEGDNTEIAFSKMQITKLP